MLQLKKINIYIVDHEIFLRPMVPMLVIEKLLIETVEKSRKKLPSTVNLSFSKLL